MSNNKKILIFTDAFSGGGAEEVMKKFSYILKEKFDVLHVSKWKGPKKQKLPYWNLSLKKNSLKESILVIYHILKRYKPDIIFTSTGHNNVLFLILKILFRNKFKVIIRESSISSVMNGFSIKSIIIDKLLVKSLYKKANKIIVQSIDMFNDLENKYKIEKSKMTIINNPILKSIEFSKKLNSNNKEKIELISIGRFSIEKGHERMLDVFELLPNNFTLKLLGSGKLESKIKKLAIEKGLSKRIFFLGYLQGKSKIKEIINSDIYIQTSFVEGFPNSLLESISIGVPAIAFNVKGGTKEIINKANGILIDNGNINEMKKAILNFDSNNFNPADMLLDIKNRFGSEKIKMELLNLFTNEI